jgi:pyruvate/2-oxoglutarate dehydrogenase complex dihydrolipoamide acyltransferase (E2) component
VMPNIDISVAVATQNGLITPIVKNVPSRSDLRVTFPAIPAERHDFASRAQCCKRVCKLLCDTL